MPSRTGGVNLPWPLSLALGCLQFPAAVSGLLPWPRAQQLPCLSDLSPGPGAVLPYLLWDAGGRAHCGRAPALRGGHAVTGELEWSGTGLRAPATLPASKLRGHWPGQDRAALCLLLLPVPSSSLLCPCIILTTWPLPLPPKTVTCVLMGCHPRGIALGPEQRTFDVSTSKNPKYHDIVSHWMSTGTTSPVLLAQWGRSWVCPCEQVMSSPDVLTPHPGALHGLQASTERGMWGTSSRDSRVGKQAKHQGA